MPHIRYSDDLFSKISCDENKMNFQRFIARTAKVSKFPEEFEKISVGKSSSCEVF